MSLQVWPLVRRKSFYDRLSETLQEIEAEGLYKRERTITSQQFSEIDVRKPMAGNAMS
jgi:hypothetical protein